MPSKSKSSSFVGDAAGQTHIRAERKRGSLVLKVDEALADRLGLASTRLAAATVDLGDGLALLLLAGDTGRGSIHIVRRGTGRVEIIVSGADETTAEEADLGVDAISAAFLRLKEGFFERGELDVSGPQLPEDVEALAARKCKELDRLLDK